MSLADATWARFCEGPLTLGADPGVQAAWHQGRRRYAVWVLRVGGEGLLDRVRGARSAPGDAIEPLADDDLHLTLHVAGFPTDRPALDDDVDLRTLDAQARALEGACAPALALGGANAFLTAAFLEVHALDGGLDGLRARLAAHHAELRFAPYLPHLTLGRFPRAVPTAPLARALAPWRALPPLPLTARAVELVTFDALAPGAGLATERRVPLGDPP